MSYIEQRADKKNPNNSKTIMIQEQVTLRSIFSMKSASNNGMVTILMISVTNSRDKLSILSIQLSKGYTLLR